MKEAKLGLGNEREEKGKNASLLEKRTGSGVKLWDEVKTLEFTL